MTAPPAGWTTGRFSLGLRLSAGYLAVIALGMLAGAVFAFLAGEPTAGALLAAGGLYVGHLVRFSTCAWRMRRRRGRNPRLVPSPDGKAHGVRFGYSPGPYYWLAALLAMTVLAALVLAVAVPELDARAVSWSFA
jgi:hypothetical protein